MTRNLVAALPTSARGSRLGPELAIACCMDRNETEACLRILFAVAVADGTVSADEERALAILAGYDGSEEMPRLLDIQKEAGRIKSSAARHATFDAAVAIAEVDGRCTKEEHALLEQLRGSLGVPSLPPPAEAEVSWRERLEEPRAKLAAAEVKFLHTLADKGGDLSTQAYAALVEELRQQRSAILNEALAPITHEG